MFPRRALIALAVFAACAQSARADVKLPAVIGDNMVLQQGTHLPFWGTAEPGEAVTVTIGGSSASAKADDKGNWKVELPAVSAAGPVAVAVKGNNEIALKNVIVGEVWVCSGQSNMEWPMSLTRDAKSEIATAANPQIRLFRVAHMVSGEPQTDVQGSWVECTPENVKDFSAVAYFFGRDIHNATKRPVGLIETAWGGTPAEAWTSRPMLETNDAFAPILARWDEVVKNADAAKAEYDKQMAAWTEAAAKAKEKGEAEPAKPQPPLMPDHPHRAAGLYNGMVAPLVPYAIKGAIWYQGESNASRAYQYRSLFAAMIRDWRAAWNQGDFPFVFVQLANFMPTAPEPGDSDWAELREAQLMTLSLPNTGMAVITDIGEADDIHPRNKQDVGARLGLAAGHLAYGRKGEFSGPVYRAMTREGNRIRVHFDHDGRGLAAKYGQPLKGFAIAGKDRKFVWAKAVIQGNTVLVSSDQVPEPAAVRYGWANNPVCNFFNTEGLPATPFRTDDWPGVTVENK